MKKYIFIIALSTISTITHAQISIGGKQTVEGTSTLLDFNNTANNTSGIILPAVNNVSNALGAIPAENNGTFLFDKSNQKLRMYQNNEWVDLSAQGSSALISANVSQASTSNSGTVIGSQQPSNARGVLVLESPNKAIILPKISNPHLNVKSPYPGMICYDTASKTMAVFNGSVWNYWK